MNKQHTRLKASIATTGALILSAGITACSYSGSEDAKTGYMNNGEMAKQAMVDGSTATPSDYKNWPKFVPTVDKAATPQVRELYINQAGMMSKRGDDFPSGTVSVMELYEAQKLADGKPRMDAKGNLVKGKLSKIFIMEKGKGWGSQQPAGTIDNGDWIYSAYLADGKTPATKDFAACRSCHLPLADKDYIARYDEHFDYHKK